MIEKEKKVFFTGAGMSRERGLSIFSGEGDMWNMINYDIVVTEPMTVIGLSQHLKKILR